VLGSQLEQSRTLRQGRRGCRLPPLTSAIADLGAIRRTLRAGFAHSIAVAYLRRDVVAAELSLNAASEAFERSDEPVGLQRRAITGLRGDARW
jgi:hypothetical protein